MSSGVLFIISSPSGGGKGSILKEVVTRNPNIKISISATTRTPRAGELDGVHYFFLEPEAFLDLVDDNKMLEHEKYCGNYYGTPRAPVENWLEQGFDVIVEIEVMGGMQVKRNLPDAVSIFIAPPSLTVLEDRLRKRGTETEDAVKGRLKTAEIELRHIPNYDYMVVNDHLEDAIAEVESIVKAEKLRSSRNLERIERMFILC